MFNSDYSIKYRFRDMFSSGEYIITNENDDRIEEQIPIDFCNLLEWMKNKSIKNLTFTGKNYFDGIVCKINYNDLLTIKKNYYNNWFNEEAFQFDYIGGADF